MQFKHLLTLCFFALTCLFVQPALAQNKVITGKVIDKKDNSPLIGVSVGTAGGIGTLTSVDGTFRLSVPEGTTSLNFTYLGYKPTTASISGQTSISVSMESASTSLNEVVVIGYGTQRVKDATGSVASLSPREFNKGVIATPEQLLQGRIAGVQVTPASGEPGAGATINIRGTNSIRSNNNPLYVIDGVPIDNSGTSGGLDNGSGTSAARNPLAFLNPNDIENISILKDASSAAIYGTRGANGVVLITTRKGRKGQGIQFSANTSISNVAKRYDLLNRDQFITGLKNAGANADPVADGGIDYGANTDWQDQIFRTGVSQSYNLGFGGGNNTGNYRASFGYDNQQGTVKNSDLRRLTGRFNASQSLFKNFIKLDLTFLASNVKDRFAPITNNAGFEGSLIGAAILANPTFPIYDQSSTPGSPKYFTPYGYDPSGFPKNSFRNPVAMLDLIDDRDNINRYLTNFSLTANITNSLSYKGTFGYDFSTGHRNTYLAGDLPGYTGTTSFRNSSPIDAVTGNGRGYFQHQQLMTTLVEHTLTYDKKMADNSSLTILGGFSYQNFRNFGENDVRYKSYERHKLLTIPSQYTRRLPIFGDSTKSELQSYFGRANYSYKDKYLITATVRVDGSSKFGSDNKYATFPAFAAKWKIMNESFAPKGIFDDLSLRLNYGKTGNQELPPYSSLYVFQQQLNGSTLPLYNPNPKLKWETTTAYGAGIDFAIFKNRLSGTIDYFDKRTKDLIFLQDYAAPAAATARYVNLDGTVKNTGIEVGLNLQAVQGEKFTWEVAYNMTFIKNKLIDFGNRNVITGNIDGPGLSGAFSQVFTNGQPLASFRVPIFGGFDENGLGIYPNGDKGVIVGSALPKFTAGLTNNFNYGNFNLSIFLNAATGFYIYNNTANAYFIKGNLVNGRNVTQEVANSSENPLNSGEVSTRFLEKGDFLRLSNASLGYTFNLTNSKAIKSLRVSLSGQNLFLITNYSGLDPEINVNKQRGDVPSRGIDYTAYPSARTFTIGLNAGF